MPARIDPWEVARLCDDFSDALRRWLESGDPVRKIHELQRKSERAAAERDARRAAVILAAVALEWGIPPVALTKLLAGRYGPDFLVRSSGNDEWFSSYEKNVQPLWKVMDDLRARAAVELERMRIKEKSIDDRSSNRKDRPKRHESRSPRKEKAKGGRPRVSKEEDAKRRSLVADWERAKASRVSRKDFCADRGCTVAYLDLCKNWKTQRTNRGTAV